MKTVLFLILVSAFSSAEDLINIECKGLDSNIHPNTFKGEIQLDLESDNKVSGVAFLETNTLVMNGQTGKIEPKSETLIEDGLTGERTLFAAGEFAANEIESVSVGKTFRAQADSGTPSNAKRLHDGAQRQDQRQNKVGINLALGLKGANSTLIYKGSQFSADCQRVAKSQNEDSK